MQWSLVCLDVPWSPEGFTFHSGTIFLGYSLLWVRIIFLQGSFCLLLYIQSWFLDAADRFVWSGTGPEGGKSCASGRTGSVPHPPHAGVPSAEDPGQNHFGLFPLQALPPSAVHWNFKFPPWVLSRNCNRLVELVE